MSMRRFFLLTFAALLFAATSVSPAISGISMKNSSPVIVADGDMPSPGECGLFDPCRNSQTA